MDEVKIQQNSETFFDPFLFDESFQIYVDPEG